MKPYLTDKCPKCGGTAYAEGIDVGVGYRYEPLHCECGWSEMCSTKNEENCENCTMYANCFLQEKLKDKICPNCDSKNIGIDKWDMFEGKKDWFYYCKECDNPF